MANETVTHTCGHTSTHQMYGKHTDRDRKAAWLASQPCMDCMRKAEADKAAADAEARGLIELTGSDKQVAWAGSIRTKTIQDVEGLASRTNDDGRKMIEIVIAWMGSISDARTWIDRRDWSLRQWSAAAHDAGVC